MKVVILISVFQRGGAERQAFLLARELLQRPGVDVAVWALLYDGDYRREYTLAGIPTDIVGFRRPSFAWQWPWQVMRLAKALRGKGIDVLLPFTTWPNVVGALAYRIAGIPVCIWGERAAGSERIPFVERVAVRLASSFAANSTAGIAFLSGELSVPAEKLTLVPNGVEVPRKIRDMDWRSDLGLISGQLLTVKIANITRFKDHSTLLNSWANVQNRWPACYPRPVLALAGLAGDQQDNCTRLVEELRLAKVVRFLGLVDDVPALIRCADLAVFSSRCEGMPNGILECMAVGKVVVSTDLPGVRDALGNGCDKFLASPGDSSGLADRLLEMLLDPAARDRAGRLNLERVQSHFSVKQMADRLLNLIASCGGIGSASSAQATLGPNNTADTSARLLAAERMEHSS